jgi:hypothetical protein
VNLVGLFVLEKPCEITPDLLSLLEAGFVREPGERLSTLILPNRKNSTALRPVTNLNDIVVLFLAKLHCLPQYLRVERPG